MYGMKVNEYITKAIFTGPNRDIYRTHLYRTYFGQGLGYVQDNLGQNTGHHIFDKHILKKDKDRT